MWHSELQPILAELPWVPAVYSSFWKINYIDLIRYHWHLNLRIFFINEVHLVLCPFDRGDVVVNWTVMEKTFSYAKHCNHIIKSRSFFILFTFREIGSHSLLSHFFGAKELKNLDEEITCKYFFRFASRALISGVKVGMTFLRSFLLSRSTSLLEQT